MNIAIAVQLSLLPDRRQGPDRRRYRRIDAVRLSLAAERLAAQRGRECAQVARDLDLPYDALVKWARAHGLVRRRFVTPLADLTAACYRCPYCGGKSQGPSHAACRERHEAA